MEITKQFSIKAAISYALKTYFKNLGFFAINFVLIYCGTILCDLLNIPLIPFFSIRDSTIASSHYTILGIMLLILGFLYYISINRSLLVDYNAQSLRFVNLFKRHSTSGSYIIISIIFVALSLILGLLVAYLIFDDRFISDPFWLLFYSFCIWFLLVLMPLSIYGFSDYIALEKKTNTRESFIASSDISRGNALKITIFYSLLGILVARFSISNLAIIWLMVSLPVSLFALTHKGILAIFPLLKHISMDWNFAVERYALLIIPSSIIFYIFGVVLPIFLMIKVSVYRQLSNSTFEKMH